MGSRETEDVQTKNGLIAAWWIKKNQNDNSEMPCTSLCSYKAGMSPAYIMKYDGCLMNRLDYRNRNRPVTSHLQAGHHLGHQTQNWLWRLGASVASSPTEGSHPKIACAYKYLKYWMDQRQLKRASHHKWNVKVCPLCFIRCCYFLQSCGTGSTLFLKLKATCST